MTVESSSGVAMPGELVRNYFNNLVGMYFKILPLYESKESSLGAYMKNLRDELEGCSEVIQAIESDARFMSLIATLQFLISELDDDTCTNSVFKQKVFGAISVCNKLSDQYGGDK